MPVSRLTAIGMLLLIPFILVGCGTPDTSGLPDEPMFATKSKDEILLRYKHVNGQKTDFETTFDIDSTADVGGQKVTIKMKVLMSGYYKVKHVDSLNTATVDIVLTRMSFDMGMGPRTISYDSDKPLPRHMRALKGLKAMLNVPIEAKITERGQVTDVNTRRLELALTHANAPAQFASQMRNSFKQMNDYSFIHFPEGKVSAGYVMDFGNVTKQLDQSTSVSMRLKVKVAAISADKRRVLLIQLAEPTSSDSSLKDLKYTGWALFDTEKGTITKSSAQFSLTKSVTMGSITAEATAVARVKYFAE